MPQHQSMSRGIQRGEHYHYPLPALREAIVNSVCHRDYTVNGSAIRIILFEGTLEIRSPGGLPNTLTIDSMPYRQFTRNQMIASFLTGCGYMEQRGKSILRIRRLCEENRTQCDFSLSSDGTEFVVSLAETSGRLHKAGWAKRKLTRGENEFIR